MKYRFWYKISAYKGQYPTSGIQEQLYWKDMPFECRNKWNWYFKYRAALLQIKYPKNLVQSSWGKVEITQESQASHRLSYLRKSRSHLKGMVTKYINAIHKYEEAQKEVLIPNNDNPKYKTALESLDMYQGQLEAVQKEIIELEAIV